MTQQTHHTLYKSNLIFKWGRQVVKAQEKGMKRASQTTRMNTKRKKNKYIWIFFLLLLNSRNLLDANTIVGKKSSC